MGSFFGGGFGAETDHRHAGRSSRTFKGRDIEHPIDLTLEYGVEFIEDDELVEITPKSIRLRKRFLNPEDRKRAKKQAAAAAAE